MMKRILFYKFLLVFLITAGVWSCKNIMDFHQQYIKDGEIVYLPKMDSIVSYAGKNRVQLSGFLSNAYNVNKIVVYWNLRADSMIFNYTKTNNYTKGKVHDMDSMNLIIPNLPEKSYIFDIYTINDVGNRSIKVSVSGTSYGAFFRANLAPRTMKSYSFDGKIFTSTWISADNLERETQIRYTTEANVLTTVFLSRDLATIDLPKQKYGTSISVRSVYVPESVSIDTFYCAWVTKPVIYNPYIGDYASAGTIMDPVTGVSVINRYKVITRIDDVTAQLEVGDKGDTYTMKMVVNADNTVTLTPSGTTPNIDQSIGINKYDPATKAFTLNYSFNVAAPQIISEVVTKYPLDKVLKTGWKIVAFDSQEPAEGAPNGLATSVIDDNLNTFWHSQWDLAEPAFPHWFVIDLGSNVSVAAIEVFRRQGVGDGQTKHQFFTSSDGVIWNNFGTFPMDVTTNNGQKFISTTKPTVRYIKYVALQGPNFYAHLAELNVYTPMQ